jgi:hypothetical protein
MKKFLFLAVSIFFASYASTETDNTTKNIDQAARDIREHLRFIEHIENTIKIGRLINAGQYEQAIKILKNPCTTLPGFRRPYLEKPEECDQATQKHFITQQYEEKVLSALTRYANYRKWIEYRAGYFAFTEAPSKEKIVSTEKELINLSAEERNKLNEKAKSLAKIAEAYTQAQQK